MPAWGRMAQATLAGAILISTIGTYIGLSPPNGSIEQSPSVDDSLSFLGLTGTSFGKLALSPLFLLSLHTAVLTLLYPDLPQSVLRHGSANGFNNNLIVWSLSTVMPLSLLSVGLSLRLIPYATLGSNFTFALTLPDHLVTKGIYSYVQHPSYDGLALLVLANFMLLGRTDGVISCWIPPRWHRKVRGLAKWFLGPTGLSILLFAMWTRVIEEETMLNREFGKEWKTWHNHTARFIPGVF